MAYERHFKIQNATCLREKVDPFSSPSNKLLDHLLNLVNEEKADGSGRSVNSLNTLDRLFLQLQELMESLRVKMRLCVCL